MSSRNLTSTPVLSTVVMLTTTQSCAHSSCYGSTRSTVVSLSDWWLIQTMSAPGVMAQLGLSVAELWLKWVSMAPWLMWGPLSATCVICCTRVGAATVTLLLLCGVGKLRKLFPVLTTRHLSSRIPGKVYEACVRSAMLLGRDQITLNYSGSAIMTIPLSAGSVALNTGTKHPQIHKLGMEDIVSVLRCRQLIWYGHIQRATSCIKSITNSLALGSKECLGSPGLNMRRLMSIIVAASVSHCLILPTP